MKDQYRIETNKDVYAETGDFEAGKCSYNDDYVHWLETKIIHRQEYLDKCAIAAMQAILNKEGEYRNGGPGSEPKGVVPSETAKTAYKFAEAMLAERERREKQ